MGIIALQIKKMTHQEVCAPEGQMGDVVSTELTVTWLTLKGQVIEAGAASSPIRLH